MKQRYVIKGTNRIGDKVRLSLMFDDIVKKKDKMGIIQMAQMMGDPEQASLIQESMQQQALLMQYPDTITIPYEEWKKYEYKIDDIVWVDITSEEKMEKC